MKNEIYINERLKSKISKILKNLNYGRSKKLFLLMTDVICVQRDVAGNLGDVPDGTYMTVREALKYGAWDTERGTMRVNITVATGYGDCGSDVIKDGDRCFITISDNQNEN